AGMVLDQPAYEKLMAALQLDKAKFKALDMISRGSKSEKQMREKLIQAEYSEYIVEEVMQFLKKYQYIDDDALAKRYIESKSQYSHKSLRQIKAELYRKGIVVDQVKDYCEETEEREEANIEYFLDKFRYNPTWDIKQKQKIINRLLTRGFQYSQVEKCLRKRNEGFDA
ncbi:MAG: RecX family transcriptional regulator, partial [Candidatus Niameybacter stercoravium]|nr:RecX family transcriptional regulator [Candidatus Niameybacter stercoravium]